MPIRHAIWKISDPPERLAPSQLDSEQHLETMIVAEPGILSDEWMLVGRQERTQSGGRIDLLAIAADGSLILIELKRNLTPRDVVAQALDYATWVETLTLQAIDGIYKRFAPTRNFIEDFRSRFGQSLQEGALNQSHLIIIVASHMDDSTERIVRYLSDRDIPINVLFFQVFAHGAEQLLSRAWLIDPERTQDNAEKRTVGPNYAGRIDFEGILEKCTQEGDKIVVGFDGGLAQLRKTGLSALQDRKYKWDYASGGTGVKQTSNWLHGEEFRKACEEIKNKGQAGAPMAAQGDEGGETRTSCS